MKLASNQNISEEVLLIFPNQLFAAHKAFAKKIPIVLIEEYLFFSQYLFHQQKLVLHRASMQCWMEEMKQKGYGVSYVEAADNPDADIRKWLKGASEIGIKSIHAIDPVDYLLKKRITQGCASFNLKLTWYDNPLFLNKLEEGISFFEQKKRYHQTDFYIAERKKRNLLLEGDNKPMGGKWTFDGENREKFPKNETVPDYPFPEPNEYVKEAKSYVKTHFANHYGKADDFKYPVSRKQALDWLEDFLEMRFAKFGVYEDAMVAEEKYLYHSVLTPMLNTGLLLSSEIVEAAQQKASEKEIPLNSLEGFIRQIVGWREFIRIIYELEGSGQRTKNYWGFTRKIPPAFWSGETGIGPVDIVIKKLLDTSYNHHIERLMVLGNFFLLCEFDPDEVYKWFMEMYIDAYDWVMVPNVYGMTQFADGGLMTTKPYISGSNYLMKMGNWPKGEWQATWDGLFWRFMDVHRDFFTQNPRLGMLIGTFDKMKPEKRTAHLENAAAFLKQLDEWNKESSIKNNK